MSNGELPDVLNIALEKLNDYQISEKGERRRQLVVKKLDNVLTEEEQLEFENLTEELRVILKPIDTYR